MDSGRQTERESDRDRAQAKREEETFRKQGSMEDDLREKKKAA